MAPKYLHTEVDGRKLRLSNLEKVIYPASNITKAEIIQYYLDVATLYLKFSANRPTTLIRYPDGIDKASFYAKTAPDWTPDWIKQVGIQHSEESINYLVPADKASVVWLANLSALELHPGQMLWDRLDVPDYIVFDLDPDPNQSFEEIKTVAADLASFLKGYDYHPYLKTSGSKGLHIFVPLSPVSDHDSMVETVKGLTKTFIKNNNNCTLHIQKNKRVGKILIDIYRNHKAQTTVAPYSLRAKANAPISMPLQWEDLEKLESSAQYHIRNYKDYLAKSETAWSDFYENRVELHTLRQQYAMPDPDKIHPSLQSYFDKRDFAQTNEPIPLVDKKDLRRFVIQIHNASNLHYDLRLEKDGVLISWAIPKAIPTGEGEKRFAVQTEPHPIKYLNFEGIIPKGEYGAGQMWIMNKGEINWIKQTDKSYEFRLNGNLFSGHFKLFHTKDDQWMIERKSEFIDPISTKPSHMLAGVVDKLNESSEFLYEIKWDGIRIFLIKDGDQISIKSRSGRDITSGFPEIVAHAQKQIKHYSCIADGELVCLDEMGRPIFSKIISRMHTQGSTNIESASRHNPSVAYLFDCIQLDGIDISNLPLYKRQEWLNVGIKTSEQIRISESWKDGKALLDAARKMDLEGIMIKRRESHYYEGKRTDDWLKLKFRNTASCQIIGYTEGKGDRVKLFGSLHLVEKVDGEWIYRGRVGTGFNGAKMKVLKEKFEAFETQEPWYKEKLEEAAVTTWLKEGLYCEIQFASLTPNKTFREPVFLHLREDLT